MYIYEGDPDVYSSLLVVNNLFRHCYKERTFLTLPFQNPTRHRSLAPLELHQKIQYHTLVLQYSLQKDLR
jgi:hypothetical protein